MATRYSNNRRRNNKPTELVDINSNTQVVKIHQKKGKVLSIISICLAVLLIFFGRNAC